MELLVRLIWDTTATVGVADLLLLLDRLRSYSGELRGEHDRYRDG